MRSVAKNYLFCGATLLCLAQTAAAQDILFGIPEFDEEDFEVLDVVDDETVLVASADVNFMCLLNKGTAHLSIGRCLPILGSRRSEEIEAAILKAEADRFALEVEERAAAESARVALAIGEGRAQVALPTTKQALLSMDPVLFDGLVTNSLVLSGCSVEMPFDLFVSGTSQGLFLTNLGLSEQELLTPSDDLFKMISDSFDRLFLGGNLILRNSNTIAELKDCK